MRWVEKSGHQISCFINEEWKCNIKRIPRGEYFKEFRLETIFGMVNLPVVAAIFIGE
jgi:hypothetical protein